ncbi:fluoride efflux transporter CrcB [Anaerobacillus sp. HL2]|nr:fluoride efflux transporter CrcB [Anaerobacillus sp. HL2]
MNLFLVMIGGALGAMLRYLFGLFVMIKFPHPSIPIAMLAVNILGSLGLGLFLGNFLSKHIYLNIYELPLYVLVAVGFFGAFTTFSTFSVESIQLIRDRNIKKAILYILISITGSISFFFCFWALVFP